MEGRGTLAFSRLDDVMPEVDRLLKGHRTLGNWSLGQICNHLVGSFAFAVEGTTLRAPWLFRKTIGPLVLARILKTGRFPGWIKLPRRFEPRPGLDARAEAEALRAAIGYFAAHPGPFSDHPLGGPMDRATWERLQRVHCAHHLTFVVPDGEPPG